MPTDFIDDTSLLVYTPAARQCTSPNARARSRAMAAWGPHALASTGGEGKTVCASDSAPTAGQADAQNPRCIDKRGQKQRSHTTHHVGPVAPRPRLSTPNPADTRLWRNYPLPPPFFVALFLFPSHIESGISALGHFFSPCTPLHMFDAHMSAGRDAHTEDRKKERGRHILFHFREVGTLD